MGAVFLAERADEQFQKQVAVKLLPGIFPSPAMERAMEGERQILAGLEHPNIARLLDAGVAEDGTHYMVMEYVEGVPINQHCLRQGLGERERLRLFRDVLGAVHYAHRHLVVHRDLKPSNILVTAEGVVKLLDFGIAKLLEGTPGEGREPRTMLLALTPDYAAPEQLRGGAITTASDTYSLGVLLHELVSGKPPWRVAGETLEEILPESSTIKFDVAFDLGMLGGAANHRGDLPAALALYQRTLVLRRQVLKSDPGNALVQHRYFWLLVEIARLRRKMGDTAGARASYREAIDALPRLPAARSDLSWHVAIGQAYAGYGLLLVESDSQHVEGCSWLRRAQEEWRAALNIRGSIVRLEDQEEQALEKALTDHCASPSARTESVPLPRSRQR